MGSALRLMLDYLNEGNVGIISAHGTTQSLGLLKIRIVEEMGHFCKTLAWRLIYMIFGGIRPGQGLANISERNI